MAAGMDGRSGAAPLDDRLGSLADLTGGLAHDFNNLLTVIRGAAELMERLPPAEAEIQRHAIIDAADRAAALTQQLLAFSRRQPLRGEAVALAPLLGQLRDELAASAGPAVRVRVLLPANLHPIAADPGGLAEALRAAARNAVDAMPDGGVLTLSALNVQGEGAPQVRLAITDSGSGMAPEIAARAFDPFFTTKPVGEGSGLGLAQIHGFAAQSAGHAELETAPGRGTTLAIVLPAATASPAERPVRAAGAPQAGTRVLLVEDSNTVAAFAEALLADMGCLVTRAASAPEALARLTEARFDIMFSDIVMPGMSGIDLAHRVRHDHPRLPILLATAHSDQVAQNGSEWPILPKPYRREALARMMGDVMAA